MYHNVKHIKGKIERSIIHYLVPKWIKQKIKDEIIKPDESFYFSHKGYCPCCDQEVTFRAWNSWLRDYFYCTNCYSIPRERALIVTVEKYFPNWRDLVIHESSSNDHGASRKIKTNCAQYISTQYYPGNPPGSIINGYRNENLECLTFPDSVFDLVITQDVFEHIYNPANAFNEIARTLKKGGAHIFTVPIINKHNKTEIWAKRGEDGNPVFLGSPEWHGNPIDSRGSPVTMHWGFDIVDFIKKGSGLITTIEYIDNLDYGIRAEFIEVLVSEKKVPDLISESQGEDY